MIKVLLFLIIFFPSFVYGGCASTCHATEPEINISNEIIAYEKTHLNVREATNNNDNPEIDKWLKFCGLGPGYSYCQAFQAYSFDVVFKSINLKSPYPNYAGVARFAEYCSKRPLTFKVISSKQIKWGIYTPEPGDIASWKHGSSTFSGYNYYGHAGLVRYIDKNLNIYTIEANTKAGNGGDQSGSIKGDMTDGLEGVYERTRTIGLQSNFPIMYFIRLNKRVYTNEN
jgi:hypothetical protein